MASTEKRDVVSEVTTTVPPNDTENRGKHSSSSEVTDDPPIPPPRRTPKSYGYSNTVKNQSKLRNQNDWEKYNSDLLPKRSHPLVHSNLEENDSSRHLTNSGTSNRLRPISLILDTHIPSVNVSAPPPLTTDLLKHNLVNKQTPPINLVNRYPSSIASHPKRYSLQLPLDKPSSPVCQIGDPLNPSNITASILPPSRRRRVYSQIVFNQRLVPSS